VDVVYLEVLDGRGPIKVSVLAGSRAPAHATALGKILLAALPDSTIRQLYEKNPPVSRTALTLTDIEALIAQLNQVRERGYSTNFGENIDNVHSVGAPIRDSSNCVVAGVSLAYPGPLVEAERIPRLIALVCEIADAISFRLGAPTSGPDEGSRAVISSMEKGVY
jgi:DNA-binding IclR family transcriptional regulator